MSATQEPRPLGECGCTQPTCPHHRLGHLTDEPEHPFRLLFGKKVCAACFEYAKGVIDGQRAAIEGSLFKRGAK